MAMARRRVGEILKAKGKVNDQQIEEALNSQKSTAKTIGPVSYTHLTLPTKA